MKFAIVLILFFVHYEFCTSNKVQDNSGQSAEDSLEHQGYQYALVGGKHVGVAVSAPQTEGDGSIGKASFGYRFRRSPSEDESSTAGNQVAGNKVQIDLTVGEPEQGTGTTTTVRPVVTTPRARLTTTRRPRPSLPLDFQKILLQLIEMNPELVDSKFVQAQFGF